MAPRPKLRMAMIKCGSCGKRYSNPLAHTCMLTGKRKRGRTKFAPKVSASVKCPRCGKPYANPLTHTCRIKSDFKQRKKEAAKRERAAQREANKHPYDACPDGDGCNRYPCRIYREGKQQGQHEGYQDGHREGYDEGFRAGSRAAA